MLQYSFNPLAEVELNEAVDNYRAIRVELGMKFEQAASAAIEFLRQHPEAAPVCRGRIRKKVLLEFPYSIFYSASTTELRILCFGHHKRQPLYWLGRH